MLGLEDVPQSTSDSRDLQPRAQHAHGHPWPANTCLRAVLLTLGQEGYSQQFREEPCPSAQPRETPLE